MADENNDYDKEIYFIRHGETDWNKQGLTQGAKNDIELNHKGKEQSTMTAEFLKSKLKNDEKYDLILSSPLTRAIQTASIIADVVNYVDDILVKDYLTETDLGKLAIGLTDEQLKKDSFYDDFYKEMNKYFMLDHIDKKLAFDNMPKIFEDKYEMESHSSIRERINSLITFLRKTKHKKIIVVTHNGTIEWINRVILNTNDAIKGDLTNGKNCHLSFYLLIDGKFKLIIAPNTLHLKNK